MGSKQENNNMNNTTNPCDNATTIILYNFIKRTFLTILIAILLFGCIQDNNDQSMENHFHAIDYGKDLQHGGDFTLKIEYCKTCHGEDLQGGHTDSSCLTCHHKNNWKNTNHGNEYISNIETCLSCHGIDMEGGLVETSCINCHHNGGWGNDNPHGQGLSESCYGCHANLESSSCNSCHHGEWNNLEEWINSHDEAFSSNPAGCRKSCHTDDSSLSCQICHHLDWNELYNSHGDAFKEKEDSCKHCHGDDLHGGSSHISCETCHHDYWSSICDTHGEAFCIDEDTCKDCHGNDLNGGASSISCDNCHHKYWTGSFESHGEAYSASPDDCNMYCHGENGSRYCHNCHHEHEVSPWQHGSTHTDPNECTDCHGEDLSGGNSMVSCSTSSCHTDVENFSCITCHDGTTGSHLIHTTQNSRGPSPLTCEDCHNTDNFLLFADGNDINNTTVCDNCHSTNGAYNGNAKDNWRNGVYEIIEDVPHLKSGQEMWCIGCHDDLPANSVKDGSEINAPNIAGDDSIYGFYVNGHGRATAERGCLDCHDATAPHIDGNARTYESTLNNYRSGYRLNEDMSIPRDPNIEASQSFTLCTNCHDYSNFNITNFRNDNSNINYHSFHFIAFSISIWDSDWNGETDSDISCTACHNVHGSPMEDLEGNLFSNPVMIRHGELIGHVPALNFRWMDSSGNFTNNLEDSFFGNMDAGVSNPRDPSLNHVCGGCHNSTNIQIIYSRTPTVTLP